MCKEIIEKKYLISLFTLGILTSDDSLLNNVLKELRKYRYRKSSIKSRPCISSNPKFPRLLLEVFQKLQFLEQNFLSEAAHKGPNRVILKNLNFLPIIKACTDPPLPDL